MDVRIETPLPVTPESFWSRLFFNRAYNEGLHRELGFARYEVCEEERAPDGSVSWVLETEPPLHAPDVVKRRIGKALTITERGSFEASSGVYRFEHVPGLASGSTRIVGTIHVEPAPHGVTHIVQVELSVSAFGLGSLIERAIERSLRESFATMGRYAAQYAAAHGFALPT